MSCGQCGRPAMYRFEKEGQTLLLCLDCNVKFQDLNYRGFLMNAAMMNHALDEMDAILPIGSSGGRIPVAEMARAMTKASTYNNIVIRDSTVGVLNTGDLARIDAVITLSNGTDADAAGKKIKEIAQAILDANEIDATDRKEMLDILQAIAEQVVGSQGSSKKSVAVALWRSLEERAKAFAAIGTLIGQLGPILISFFGS